jgi:uncharacterized membrane protein YphA (DoxX/SURF4 family)
MKKAWVIIRWFVGILFIFSGLVKANDPYGLSYKMQEFFEAWNMHGFHDFTLSMAILMNVFEIVAGVALIVGWRMRLFSWMVLLLIIFFTFLTGYATYATNPDGSMKFRSCGCFGDCIPLDPRQSFWKDILLLVLTITLVIVQSKIKPLFRSDKINASLVILSCIFAFAFQIYVLRYLPVVDCLPYKPGNRMLELRKMPEDAVPDKFDIRFVYEKNGVKQEFPMTSLPDSTWTFAERKQVLVEKGKNNEPKIKDFILSDSDGNDVTENVLSIKGEHYLLFILNTEDIDMDMQWVRQLTEMIREKKKIHIISAVPDQVRSLFSFSVVQTKLPILACDGTAIKTAARAIPTLYKMEEDKVIAKYSAADYEKWK